VELEIYNSDIILSKLSIIDELIRGKDVIVAFSGGVDSTVMGYLAKRYAKNILLIMQTGTSVAIGEEEFAKSQADELGLPLEFIDYDEVDFSEEYTANPHNRCYFCKELLHQFLEEIRHKRNFDVVLSGTNASDLEGHRPGHAAVIKAGVLNPLEVAGLTKQEIRWIASDADLKAAEKPASACLASRFITGVRITKNGLRRVAKAEYFLKKALGAKIVRVRDHGGFARIEFGIDEIDSFLSETTRSLIYKELMKLGYHYVTIDLEGYRPSEPLME
jgi:uncharacterized protein